AKKPWKPDLLVEKTNGRLFMVDSTSPGDFLRSTDKGENWTVKRSFLTGTKQIKNFWYDHAGSNRIYMNADVGPSPSVWYQSSSGLPVLQLGADFATNTSDKLHNLWVRDGNVECLIFDFQTTGAAVWRWSNPWAEVDQIAAWASFVSDAAVVIGTDTYFLAELDTDDVIEMMIFDGANITANATLTGYQLDRRGMSYDEDNILSSILKKTADGKFYLIEYNITGDSFTVRAEQDITFQLARNNFTGDLEKAFHASTNSIYQIQKGNNKQLHLIAKPITNDIWIAITDNFLMNDDGDIYEYEDINAYITECVINMKKMSHWTATMSQINTYLIEEGMFVVIKDTFATAENSPFIYKGTYNFKDVPVGTKGTSIDWIDWVGSADDHEIIAELDGHRKVLQTYQNSGIGECFHGFATSSTVGWAETWVYVTNANAINGFALFREGVSIRIWVRIDNNRFEYDAGAGMIDAGYPAADNTWYHVYIQWYADNTFDLWVGGVQYLDGVSTYADFTGTGISRWYVDQDSVVGKIYIDSPMGSLDDITGYTVGDNNYVAEGEDQIIFEGYVGPFTK
ncbi:hypothetical protein LCGC14_2317110, partial [marine sediment metagenome]